MTKRRRSTGFTLMESMVVIVLLSTLIAAGLPNLRMMIRRGQNMEAENMLLAIFTAQHDYARENGGAFTTDEDDLDVTIPAMKHFTLNDIGPDNSPACVGTGLAELRAIDNPRYDLWVDDAGRIICEVSGDCGDNLCAKFGY